MDSLYLAQLMMYLVLMVAIIAYATLDGFDLGVGCLHLFARTDHTRRIMINAIGPVWDGNSTWMVIGSGVLFAAFPKAFSILAPALYTPLMLMLFGFMLRAAAIEFRSKDKSVKWRSFWDIAFFTASLILALIMGLILGNLIQGMPVNIQGEIEGGLTALITPYTLTIMLLGLSCFTMHGSLYVLMKTEGAFHDQVRKWTWVTIPFFLIMWLAATVMTILTQYHMIQTFLNRPYLALMPLCTLLAIGAVPYFIYKEKDLKAFLGSCLSILSLLSLFLLGTFPYIMKSTIDPHASLTLMNSAVSESSLWILVAFSLTGVPLSFFYFPYVYRIFKGKVKIDHMSY
ncbi:MAG: cytochrome d ubiquinol oxidase subunit II [Candidatus Rhabdochlamydia sp.]